MSTTYFHDANIEVYHPKHGPAMVTWDSLGETTPQQALAFVRALLEAIDLAFDHRPDEREEP